MDNVALVQMTPAQFDAWLPGAIASYAEEHTVDGSWSADEALQRSREEHQKLLPQGLDTPDQHFWSIVRVTDRQPVGVLWAQARLKPEPHAFVYNLEIDASFRRRGYAEQAMTLLESECRRLGLDAIRLHVFGHNRAARPLYEKLGYEPTNILMVKHLE